MCRLSPVFYYLLVLFISNHVSASSPNPNETELEMRKKWVGWIKDTLDYTTNQVGEVEVLCQDMVPDRAAFPLVTSGPSLAIIDNFLNHSAKGAKFEDEFRNMITNLFPDNISDLSSANFKKMAMSEVLEAGKADLEAFNFEGEDGKKIQVKKVVIKVWNTEASKIFGKHLWWTESDEIRDIVLYVGKGSKKVPNGIWGVQSFSNDWNTKKRSRKKTFIHPLFYRKEKSKLPQ